MADRNFHRIVQVTAWRETAPVKDTNFDPTKLTYSQVVIQDLETQFKIRHTLRKNPNTCDITITNLAPDTRTFLEQKPLLCQVAAGYDNKPQLLFTGDVRFAMTELKSPNWETLLQLGDGDCNHRWARVNRSYKGGTTLRQVITDCVKSFGYALPTNLLNSSLLDQKVQGGSVSHGKAADEITRLLAPLGYTWSIQNGVFQALKADEALAGSAWQVDQAHGMIGTPEFGTPPNSGKPPHMKVKMELYPQLTAGCLIDLTSKVKNGRFRVEMVEHVGNNLHNKFETEIEIAPLSTDTSTIAAASTTLNPAATQTMSDAWDEEFKD